MIELNTKKEDDGTWVDGSHDSFRETPFHGLPFKLLIRGVTKTQYSKTINKHTRANKRGVESTDNVAVQNELYHYTLRDWEGLANEDKQEMECNTLNKEALAENYFVTFVNPIVDIALGINEVREVSKAQEEKN